MTDFLKIEKILDPETVSLKNQIREGDLKLVHYTSAKNAINIFKSKQLWMRNAMCMNDVQEIKYAVQMLGDFFTNEKAGVAFDVKQNFIETVTNISSESAIDTIALFDNHAHNILSETYVLSFSQHKPQTEDDYGRVSMWGAYSSNEAGVALVFNSEPFALQGLNVPFYVQPVRYWCKKKFIHNMQLINNRMKENIDFIEKLEPEVFGEVLWRTFMTIATCVKHPGFEEEKEWRVVFNSSVERHEPLMKSVETITQPPQIVYKFPLEDRSDLGLHGIDLNQFISRIIIGPSNYPLSMKNALETALELAHIEKPKNGIVVSDIPLRTYN